MVIFSLGMPGEFTQWVDNVTTALTTRACGATVALSANTLDDVAEALIISGAERILVGARQPNVRLRAALLQSTQPMVVSFDAPTRSAMHLLVRHQYDLVAAVRTVSACCVSLMDLRTAEHALALHAERDGTDLLATALRIAGHLGLKLEVSEILDAVAQVPADGMNRYLDPLVAEAPKGATVSPLHTAFNALSERQQAIMIEPLSLYANVFAGRDFGKVIWPRELFQIGDTPAETAIREIDITGRSRCLVFGPYLQLFAGSWSARVVLGFSAETVGSSFLIEVVAGTSVGRITIQPDAEGIYEANISFVLHDDDRPVEIRVFNERAAFDGHIGLGFVALTPILEHRDGLLSAYVNTKMLAS